MEQRINQELLRELASHTRKLGLNRFFRGMGYERHGEFPFITSVLQPFFNFPIKYLDIGSGESIYPTYLLKKTRWDISCLDKFSWVQKQHRHARRIMNNTSYEQRFHVIEKDFLECELPSETYDIITNISVIEHFEGKLDSVAMEKSAKLLKKGGMYVLTTLINGDYFREFYVNESVYGVRYKEKPVFYQRHYDVKSIEERIIQPSGLREQKRIYQGEYGFPFGKYFINVCRPLRPIKVLYQWASPFFASRFLTYRDKPVSTPNMPVTTYSCVLLVLKKE
ncbi:bifunctional 2-polyprenyl-6-hydroxyphenol methylase/3-demethylubiquinol 3-O-methyltransferase UbiG [Geobacter sp. AOG1]|uniref:class I SAM-dependent methyltransferase n=1 Tax=Geobacter sp. AOG1 TaxID=1566346 RepID=UPI001CC81281|nr:class I SAM-dependent methyltransferase [Geobacter sp. AOG1]GFE58383.1 hypothetical protein AOG1_22630 [Geobacter sp. AOG1]